MIIDRSPSDNACSRGARTHDHIGKRRLEAAEAIVDERVVRRSASAQHVHGQRRERAAPNSVMTDYDVMEVAPNVYLGDARAEECSPRPLHIAVVVHGDGMSDRPYRELAMH